MKLKDQTAIITGSAGGIGYGIADLFAKNGAKVAIADLRMEAAEKAAKEISSRHPGDAIPIEMDVTDPDMVSAGVEKVIETWGKVDILVSNAGIQIVHPIEEFPLDAWQKMFSIHMDGAFLTTKACIPHMYREGKGSIIYMGSVHSKVASKLKSPYVSAKHGLMGLARTVAEEGGKHGVRTNVVCPGFVKTPLVDKQIPEQAKTLGISEEEVVNNVMLGRTVDQEFTTIEDVAEVTLFFAAFPTNALTGQSLIVSHGWHME